MSLSYLCVTYKTRRDAEPLDHVTSKVNKWSNLTENLKNPVLVLFFKLVSVKFYSEKLSDLFFCHKLVRNLRFGVSTCISFCLVLMMFLSCVFPQSKEIIFQLQEDLMKLLNELYTVSGTNLEASLLSYTKRCSKKILFFHVCEKP